MAAVSEDRRAIACNYIEGTSPTPQGGLAYVLLPNPGSGAERVQLLARSRSGRWIEKWEDIRRLTNFRWKTIPPDHPLYERVAWWLTELDMHMILVAAVEAQRRRGLATPN